MSVSRCRWNKAHILIPCNKNRGFYTLEDKATGSGVFKCWECGKTVAKYEVEEGDKPRKKVALMLLKELRKRSK